MFLLIGIIILWLVIGWLAGLWYHYVNKMLYSIDLQLVGAIGGLIALIATISILMGTHNIGIDFRKRKK
jgi:hypothetical protein